MGYDKLINFFCKNLTNNFGDNIIINKNNGLYIGNHIFYDITFIIYNSINSVEEDINYIIKNITGLPYTDNRIIINNINTIFKKSYWKYNNLNLEKIMNGNTIDGIINNLKTELSNSEIIHNILFYNILEKINNDISNIYDIEYIKSINIFFDGIPSFSKILEQRKRRMKNYLDSKSRKENFDKYFKDIMENITTEDDVMYDYFNYINNTFSFCKSLGPNSDVMIDLAKFLEEKLSTYYVDKKIYIDGSIINGEADYKIFRYIKNNINYGDIMIHSCDSDFLHLILVFQLLSNKINYHFIKHYGENYELYRANKIIKILHSKYNSVNNCENGYINNIYDFLFLLQLFENDVLPLNYEISVELNLNHIFQTHYNICKNKNFIININSNKIINFNNFSQWIKKIKENNMLDICIILKNFKLPYTFLHTCYYKLKYTTDDIINKIFIPYIRWKASEDTFDEDDIRTKYKIKYGVLNTNPFNEMDENIRNDILLNLESIIDFSETSNYGIKKLDKYTCVNSNPYQTLYHILIDNTSTDCFNIPKISHIKQIDSMKKYITMNSNVEKYFEIIIYQTFVLFYNFDMYNPKNKLYYDMNIAPTIDTMIDYVENNDMYDIMDNIYCNIINCDKDDIYFNYTTHHLIITPYLLENLYVEEFDDINNVKSLLNITNNMMKDIWFHDNIDTFKLKKINPDIFLQNCNNIIKLLNSEFNKVLQNNIKLIKY